MNRSPAMTTALLNTLLDQGLNFAPEYHGGLSNHLPMALVALQGLGADASRLGRFAHSHAQRLQPLAADSTSPTAAPDTTSEPQGLRRPEAYRELFDSLRDRLACDGRQAVLAAVLPQLLPGIGAAAFHGLIRTAYGLDSGHDGELAAGLAYWTSRHLPLLAALPQSVRQGGNGSESDLNVARWIDTLAKACAHCPAVPGLISQRMRSVAATEAFHQHVGRLRVDTQTLAQLAALAADRYLASRDFTVLHLVTSGHALRLLLPLLDEPLAAVRWYSVAFGAALLSSHVSLNRVASCVDPLDWPELAARAIACDDEHVIKLVYSCRAEARAGDDRLYRCVASRAVLG